MLPAACSASYSQLSLPRNTYEAGTVLLPQMEDQTHKDSVLGARVTHSAHQKELGSTVQPAYGQFVFSQPDHLAGGKEHLNIQLHHIFAVS